MLTRIVDRLEAAICAIDPKDRRRIAVHLVLWTIVLGAVNIGLWLVGVVPDRVMLAITLVLSWLALTVTFADIVVGTDIRAEAVDSTP